MKKSIPYLIIAFLVFLLFRQCGKTQQIKDARLSERAFLNDSISYYQNEIGQIVSKKTALQGDKAALEILLSKQIDSTGQLKRLVREFQTTESAGNITTITKIDSIPVPYEVPVPFEFEREWTKLDPFFAISGISTQDGVTIENLSIPNITSFAIGKKKTGFFKTEYQIEAVNSNPYVKTTGLDAYSLSVPKKRLGISIYAGYGIGQNLTLNPQIGIGVSYSLIRF